MLYKKLGDIDSKIEITKSLESEKSEVLNHMIRLNWTLLGLTVVNILSAMSAILFIKNK